MFIRIPQAADTSPSTMARSFSERLSKLQAGKTRIAFYYDYPDRSTFRYRVENVIKALDLHCDDISAAHFHFGEIEHLNQVVDKCDILVLARARYTSLLEIAVRRAQRAGKPVLFDVDDLVFDPSYIPLIMDTLNVDMKSTNTWDHWFSYIGRVGYALGLCDRVTVTNDYLAEKVRAFCGKPAHVIPNTISDEEMEHANAIIHSKRKNKFARNRFVNIGYFSGSPSHDKDFRIASDALLKHMGKTHNINLTLVGYLNVDEEFGNFAGRVRRLGMQTEIDLLTQIAGCEINIAPLQINSFTNCKSELKFFEAAVVGTFSLLSPSFTFRKAAQESQGTYLVPEADWYDMIGNTVELIASNPNKFVDMIEASCKYSEKHFSSQVLYQAARSAYLA